MPHWTIYTKPGCTLCETFMVELATLLGEAAAAKVDVIDISQDPALDGRYGTKIPVLFADGDFVCCYFLDRDRVGAYMSADEVRLLRT